MGRALERSPLLSWGHNRQLPTRCLDIGLGCRARGLGLSIEYWLYSGYEGVQEGDTETDGL